MSAEERGQFHRKALDEQRHLLRTAVAGMAAGDLVQALHVAASIRILVHETGSSKPLLKYLSDNYLELLIPERIQKPEPAAPPGAKSITFFCPISIHVTSPGAKVSLNMEMDPAEYAECPLGAWWGNVCMMLPGIGPVYRRELVLGLCNKEGGAHVDANISAKYKNILESKFLSLKVDNTDLGALSSSRLVTGKAGVELLACLDKNFPPR
jgi:hypothetical protein